MSTSFPGTTDSAQAKDIRAGGVERSAVLPMRRLLRAYLSEAHYETLNSLRTPAFAIPFLILPLAIYLMFGVLMSGGESTTSEYGPGIVNYLFSGFSVLAVAMPGIFGGCMGLALEREGGLLKLTRAMPVPPGANLIGKLLMSMLVSALASASIVIAALVIGKITLTLGQVLIIWSVMVIGTIPFFAIGFFIGSMVSGSAAPAFGNLAFLPMIWLSGIFIPLPESLQSWAVIWPAFHLNQLALGLAGVSDFIFFPADMAAAVLIGVTVLFGGLAIRRLARVG